MLIFIGTVFVTVIVLAGILAFATVLVNIDLQQVNRSLYSLVADVKCSEVFKRDLLQRAMEEPMR